MQRLFKLPVFVLLSYVFILALYSPVAQAASAKEIDISVKETLAEFKSKVKGGAKFLNDAEGVLVFPAVIKAGLGIGGEYGEGALLINGKHVDYYNVTAGSIGFQLGVQKKTLVIVFLEKQALKSFQYSSGWEAGVDGSVALVKIGAGGSIDTTNIEDPIVSFVFGQKGLMYNLTLEGSKFSRIKK